MTSRRANIPSLLADILSGRTDFDLYVSTNADAYLRLIKSLNNIGFKIASTVGTPGYDDSFMKQNNISARVRMYCQGQDDRDRQFQLQVDVVLVNGNPVDVVQNFDLKCCEIWFDGRQSYCSDLDGFRSKVTEMRGPYVEKYVSGNQFLMKRVRKYENLGFVIKFQSPAREYLITTGDGRHRIETVDAFDFIMAAILRGVNNVIGFEAKVAMIRMVVDAKLSRQWQSPLPSTHEELQIFANSAYDFTKGIQILSEHFPSLKEKVHAINPHILTFMSEQRERARIDRPHSRGRARSRRTF